VAPADERLSERLATRLAEGPPLVVLVDDADRAPDHDGVLADLVAGRHPSAHVVAAAGEAVRSGFGHWSADLRRASAGLVLRPRSDLDADVLGIPLLPRWPVPLTTPGRGVLVVDGDAAPVQVAMA
jgi:S-DNA-T family DNA segregation ATPase FtsK/SpoIIIE